MLCPLYCITAYLFTYRLLISHHTAPDGPPSQFNIEAINETAIEALWGLPASNVRNGIIRGYRLFVQASGGDEMIMNITNSNTQAFIVGGLQSRTAYTVSILAYTAAGDGPRSIRLTTTTSTRKIQAHACSIIITEMHA